MTLPGFTLGAFEAEALRKRSRNRVALVLKAATIAAFVAETNVGFPDRVSLLVQNGRWATLGFYLAIWTVSVAAIYVSAFQPRVVIRVLWAIPIALSTALAWLYYQVSSSDLNVFEFISLWSARHEAARAAEFYSVHATGTLIVFASGLAIIAIPPTVSSPRLRSWLARCAWLPMVSILAIAATIIEKQGGGSQGMPRQFAPIAIAAVAGQKMAAQGTPARHAVEWTPDPTERTPHIVLLVDESVRADFLDLTPGNAHTPELARLRGRFVDFGPAVSGGNCSHYSNALLRFAASRRDTIGTVRSSPTIWEYAKKAGYRTVFIDAQAGTIKNAGLLQNFMSVQEMQLIDGFYSIHDATMDQVDFSLLEIVVRELQSPQPVFIYANKNGAHFPYDRVYPASEAVYGPTMTEAGEDTEATRIASYRNAIRWSVDQFFARFFVRADLSDAAVIYTSDHGQDLRDGHLSHCGVEQPAPVQGLVPLMAIASAPQLRTRFETGARLSRGRASQFTIAPTWLQLMGYREQDVMAVYGESMFSAPIAAPAFTSGDIFGLFSRSIQWTSVDLDQDYRDRLALEILPRKITDLQTISSRRGTSP